MIESATVAAGLSFLAGLSALAGSTAATRPFLLGVVGALPLLVFLFLVFLGAIVSGF